MKRDTIKKHEDFATAQNDPSARSAYFLIRAKKAKFENDPRYGVSVTKRSFKHAVDRNRAKRMLRDWIAFNEDLLRPEWDYVFIVRKDIFCADCYTGRGAMKKALRYMQKLPLEPVDSGDGSQLQVNDSQPEIEETQE